MSEIEILLNEYNNLWNEKFIHKESIRKFHTYIGYIVALASLALTFYGISQSDLFKIGADPQTTTKVILQAKNIISLFFVPLTPVILIILSFAINDIFHMFIIGSQIGCIEKKINSLIGGKPLLVYEHQICQSIYGESLSNNIKNIKPVKNLITIGDYFLFFPFVTFIVVLTTWYALEFIYIKIGLTLALIYLFTVGYMFIILIFLGLKLKNYINPKKDLFMLIKNLNEKIHH